MFENDTKSGIKTQNNDNTVTIVYESVQVSGVAMNGVNTEINILLDPKHSSCQGFAHTVCTNFTVVVTAHVKVIVSLF